VRFVLVEPQHAGNVGAAVRALRNLGFDRLELVRPQCDPLSPEARQMAVDAGDLLERARVHVSLDAALEGAATVVGTSRRTGKHRRPHWRMDQLAPELARLAATSELALVFGHERWGLTDHEVDRCTHLVYLPASSAYPSFNLAQAVLLAAYELRLALLVTPPEPALDPPADHASREAMYRHLERALRTIGFLEEHTAEPMMRRVRRMLGRARLTPAEVQILRGVARRVLWAATRAGLVAGKPDDPRAASARDGKR
jgi:TrmH family RNA methyltransferase